MTRVERDAMWRVVNAWNGVEVVRQFGIIPAGQRGVLRRFGHKYATVWFPENQRIPLWADLPIAIVRPARWSAR